MIFILRETRTTVRESACCLNSEASSLAAILYQGNPVRNHKQWHIRSTMHTPYDGAAGMLLHINGKFTIGKPSWRALY